MTQKIEQECSNGMARKYNFLDGFRVIHLHPSLKCNLTCKHCYSSSSPSHHNELDTKDIISFLKYAFDYGFNALSISGGEPFLYSGLEDVFTESKNLGYKNLVASNGMLLKSERAKRILQKIDLIAISLDGDQQLHDEIRNLHGAYSKMLEGLDVLADSNIDFGFIHTLTPRSWDLLPWLGEFAHEKKAKLLQLHPIELYGRAVKEFNLNGLNQEFLHKVFIFGNFMKSKYHPDLLVQLDFLHQDYINEYPEIVNYFGPDFKVNKSNFATALKTIVVNEKGDIIPISYGFSDSYKIGNIKDSFYESNMFERYFSDKWNPLYQLLEDTFNNILNDKENDLVAWTELIVKNSNASSLYSKTYS